MSREGQVDRRSFVIGSMASTAAAALKPAVAQDAKPAPNLIGKLD